MAEKDFDAFANWLINAQKEARRAQASGTITRLTEHYSFEDYDVRPKDGHYESYNTKTGEGLYTAQTISEAWRDLREQFGVRT